VKGPDLAQKTRALHTKVRRVCRILSSARPHGTHQRCLRYCGNLVPKSCLAEH